jgi:nicotinamide-nucleotide amidase
MTVSLYVIGTELTRGIISDRHIPFLCESLARMGYSVRRAVIVPDDGSIEAELEVCASDSDIILVTGGLGPTADDLTRKIIAGEAGVPLVKNQEAWEELYCRVGERIYGANESQAYIPEGFDLIPNPKGTAPGFRGTFEKKGHKVTIVAMPGPPRELQYMYLNYVEPYLSNLAGYVEKQRDEYTVFLLPEAKLDDLCQQCNVPDVSWGTRFQELRISLYVQGSTAENRKLFIERLRELAGSGLIVDSDDTDACTLLTDYLLENNLTISTAESCTSGLVAKLLTDKAGSSAWYWGGGVTYDNEAKMKLAGVNASTLEKYGAVSSQTAIEMAKGIRNVSGTDLAVSVTGIAGPTGGSDEKPVGTVWFGFSSKDRPETAVKLRFMSISRDSLRRRFATAALILTRLYAQGADIIDIASHWLYI